MQLLKEKPGDKTDEKYAKAAAVGKEERARERKREDARKRLVLFLPRGDADADRFEAAMKQVVPELFESQADVLF